MKIQGIISAAVLTISAALSAPTYACTPSDGPILSSGLLSGPNQPEIINNIGCGTYEFVGSNTQHTSPFSDRWYLYVAEDMTASISIFGIEQTEEPVQYFSAENVFDTTNLSFTLFDDDAGQFLGWASAGETLSNLALSAGKWYTLKVYGDVDSMAYRGTLETCVTQVPLGATAPLLGSALGLLIVRRKRTSTDVNA